MDDVTASFEQTKKTLLVPLMFEAGAALFDCQQFEYALALLLFHYARIGCGSLEPGKLQAILDHREKRTAGQLIKMLKTNADVSENIAEILSNALDARNELVHRILVENVETLVSSDGRESLTKEVRRLRKIVREADQALSPFICAFNEALDNIDMNDLKKQVYESFLNDHKAQQNEE